MDTGQGSAEDARLMADPACRVPAIVANQS
jgi:hypothetical protein